MVGVRQAPTRKDLIRQGKRDGLALTQKTSARYSEIQAEVSDLEARADSEKPLRAERDRLLAALKAKGVIPSKFGPGYVQKSVCGWVAVSVSDAMNTDLLTAKTPC